MLGFTRRADYALVALAALALGGERPGRPQSARSIAERYGLPPAMLMRILKDLHKCGLVQSTRGAGGGYRLACDAGEITVAAVIEAIEGPVRVAACCDGESEQELCVPCRVMAKCPISAGINRIQEMIGSFLERVTVGDLINPQDIDITILKSIPPAAGRRVSPSEGVSLTP